jgi:hypothetical protein
MNPAIRTRAAIAGTIAAAAILAAGLAAAEGVGVAFTPRRGSPMRTAIMNGLRPTVMRDLHQRVIFRVQHLRVSGKHAFLMARPLRPDGQAIDYSRTRYAEDWKAGMFDDQVVALMIRAGRHRWRVVKYDIGATDVVWEGWWKTYGASRAIFPP